MLFRQFAGEQVGFHGQVVGTFEVAILTGGTGLGDVVMNLPQHRLFAIRELASDFAQFALGSLQQLLGVLRRALRHLRGDLDLPFAAGSGRLLRCGWCWLYGRCLCRRRRLLGSGWSRLAAISLRLRLCTRLAVRGLWNDSGFRAGGRRRGSLNRRGRAGLSCRWNADDRRRRLGLNLPILIAIAS